MGGTVTFPYKFNENILIMGLNLEKKEETGKKYYNCQCLLCGKFFVSRLDHNNQSCGCIRKTRIKKLEKAIVKI